MLPPRGTHHFTRPNVLSVDWPLDPVPLILDSPHSGTIHPPDFKPSVPSAFLRQGQDSYVDDLYANAPSFGATFLRALFPRVYVDVNRSADDLDVGLFDGEWPSQVSPSEKTALGQGLIWKKCLNGTPIYDKRLSVLEAKARIDNYYTPYHQALGSLLEMAYNEFKAVWHIDCHSMPSVSSAICKEGPGHRRSDFTLGDRHGTSCSSEFTFFVKSVLENLGYAVTINDPYAGVELVRAYSSPAHNRHSLQVEINRALYMDEATFAKTDDFQKLQKNLEVLLGEITNYIRKKINL